eukprot:513077_1
MTPEQKLYYEVIRDGHPCKLYFDIEFKTEHNPGVDGVELLAIFIERLCEQLQAQFSVEISRKNIIDLDSSTGSKFSRHLICDIPGACFRDNIAVGDFVKDLCSEIKRESHFLQRTVEGLS